MLGKCLKFFLFKSFLIQFFDLIIFFLEVNNVSFFFNFFEISIPIELVDPKIIFLNFFIIYKFLLIFYIYIIDKKIVNTKLKNIDKIDLSKFYKVVLNVKT